MSPVAHRFRTASPLFYYRDSVFASTGIDVSEHFVRLHSMPCLPVYFCRISFFFMAFTRIFSVGVFVVLLQPFSEFDSATMNFSQVIVVFGVSVGDDIICIYLIWRMRANAVWTAGVLGYKRRFSLETTTTTSTTTTSTRTKGYILSFSNRLKIEFRHEPSANTTADTHDLPRANWYLPVQYSD